MQLGRLGLLACSVLLVQACDNAPKAPQQDDGRKPATHLPASAVQMHSEALFTAGSQALDTCLQSARQMDETIATFLSKPNETTLSVAQDAWLNTTLAYRRFSGARQLGLVRPNFFSHLNQLDYHIAGFPIQPGFLDKFGQYQYSGLVHDIGFALTEESLVNQHGLTDLSEVVLGVYAIEFLLFNLGAPREVRDFAQVSTLDNNLRERGFENIAEVPNNRRRALLSLQSKILLADLQGLKLTWDGVADSSIRVTWQRFSDTQKISAARDALTGAVTQLMVDIGELIRETDEPLQISPTIKASGFAQQQQFIHHALGSLTVYAAFLKQEKKASLNAFLTEAIALTETDKLSTHATMQDHWGKVFAVIKRASDALSRDY